MHHDNAPAHISKLIRNFLIKNSTTVVPQAPYSPDQAPYDFLLFRKLKIPLRGRRFESIKAIKQNSLRELKVIPQIEFQRCFVNWKKRWHKCIVSNGDYQGDQIDINK